MEDVSAHRVGVSTCISPDCTPPPDTLLLVLEGPKPPQEAFKMASFPLQTVAWWVKLTPPLHE